MIELTEDRNMNAILSYQNAQLHGRDVWVLDEQITEYDGSTYHRETLRKLLNTSKMWDYAKPLHCVVAEASQSLHIYINKTGELVLISNFMDKDEAGRRISYRFYHAPATKDVILEDFSKYCFLAGKTPTTADIQCLKYAIHLYSYRHYYVPTLIGIPALIIIMFLLRLCK